MGNVKNVTNKIVDFVPEFNAEIDLKKVSEYDFCLLNSKIIPVIICISMEKGSNQMYPDLGLKDTFMSIPYSEENELNAILQKIEGQLNYYTGENVSVTLGSETNIREGDVMIDITISGVPSPLKIRTNDKKGLFELRHPSIYN